MTPDKELIRMCDCEEVQSRFKPKVGDRFYDLKNQEIHYFGDVTGLYGDEPCKGEYVQMATAKPSGWARTGIPTIFIPRIEDMKEWLDSNGEIAEELRLENITIKFFLSLFMELIHNKIWDGEQWG
jgi:hypothetical protein